MFEFDGKGSIDRMVKAYGFKTKVSLAQKLGITDSTLANRQTRGSFPAEFIVQCALETGVSLRWLATGEGVMHEDGKSNGLSIEQLELSDGQLVKMGYLLFDKEFLPDGLQKPQCIVTDKTSYITDQIFSELYSGCYVVNIEGKIGIHDLERIPVNKLRVSGGGIKAPFECGINDITVLAKVVSITREV